MLIEYVIFHFVIIIRPFFSDPYGHLFIYFLDLSSFVFLYFFFLFLGLTFLTIHQILHI